MSRRFNGLAFALLALAAGFGSSAAAAQPSDVLTDAGEEVLQEAVDAAEKKDWAVCRTKAVGIWDKIKHPAVAAILGACEAELGMNRDAAEHLDFFLQKDKGKHPDQTKAATDRFPRVRGKVMLVTVKTNEPDATVWVDGEYQGGLPARLFLEPGERKVEVRKEGFVTKTESVTATAGGETALDEVLEPTASQGGSGGTGGADATTTTTGSGGATPSSKPIWPYIVTGAAGAIGLGFGIAGIAVSANARSDASELQCTTSDCVAQGDSLLGEANTWRAVGIAGFSLSAAAIIGTIVYAVVPAGGPKQSGQLTLLPILTPHTKGVVLGGTF